MSARGPQQAEARESAWHMCVMSREDLAECMAWNRAFADERKDHRYFEIVEDTIQPEFRFLYFAIKDAEGIVRAVQPFFVMDQDLLQGMGPRTGAVMEFIRRFWPRFLKMRTLMVGCAAGEAHLDGPEDIHRENAAALGKHLVDHARKLKARMIVLKEFPAKYRDDLECLLQHGFSRIPSLPMTKLDIDYPSFEAYMDQALNSATRKKLRKKFTAAAQAEPIELSVVTDVAADIDKVHALYLQVYERSKLHFEKLTKAYFCDLGRQMPDKTRFFLWRQSGKVIGFSMCMLQQNDFFAEYVGFDYSVALVIHLYHYAVRDMMTWAMNNGFKTFRSSALNYDPKLHLRHRLDPIDLYVRHTSRVINFFLKRALPWMEPTRYDPTLPKFPNYEDLWHPPRASKRASHA
jgi:hypothetical protein